MELEEKIKKKGITFDATINLGHILTFIGFLVTGFMAWQSLDKRVLVIEQQANYQRLRDQNQDTEQSVQTIHINESLQEIKRSVEKLNDKLDKKAGF